LSCFTARLKSCPDTKQSFSATRKVVSLKQNQFSRSPVGVRNRCKRNGFSVRIELGFVSGHDFSRAAKQLKKNSAARKVVSLKQNQFSRSPVGVRNRCKRNGFSVRIELGFVSGHDFSRAAKQLKKKFRSP
jgi:ribosomal protein S14